MNRGFVILAQNTEKTNYVECAEALAKSIKQVMPNTSMTLVTDDITESETFDNVVPLPYGDLAKDSDWKLINDWQVYEASPYDATIKLEADMYLPVNIEHFFDTLDLFDVCVCSTIRDYKGKISNVKAYRNFTTNNDLPDVYNALTFFKKSDFAKEFFDIVKDVFDNWDKYRDMFKCNTDTIVTTDWAYSIACYILGVENTTTPDENFSMVHMKQMINDQISDDWTKEFIYEFTSPLRIQTHVQLYPLHYHVKTFSKKLNDHFDRIQTVS
jgi:hypothetical protein